MDLSVSILNSCECGCGREVKLGRRYIHGHNRPRIGHIHSDETKQKIRLAMSGANNPNFGKPITEEHKRRISKANSGTNNPMFGKRPHNFGKQTPEDIRKKLRESHLGYMMPQEQKDKISNANKGKKKPPRSEEHRKKISDAHKGINCHWWIDGRTKKNNQYSEDWKSHLKESKIIRDNYVCQECRIHQDEVRFGQVERLDIHHIDYNKNNLNPVNLISLCRSCHSKTNYNREYWVQYFNESRGCDDE